MDKKVTAPSVNDTQKKSKKVLNTDEEINRFLNEILETIKD